jgi:hypothetical protein
MEVHIRRAHSSAEQLIEKNSFRQAGKPYPINVNRMYVGRRPLSKSPDINHPYGNYLSTERSDGNNDPIDYVHDRMRKLIEIREIATRCNAAKPTQYMSIGSIGNLSGSNPVYRNPDVPYRRKLDPPHSAPGLSITKNAADFNQVKGVTPKNPLPRDNEENYRPLNPAKKYVDSKGYVSDDDPSLDVRWFIKLDMHGDVIDAYKVVRDPLQEVRDRVKRSEN